MRSPDASFVSSDRLPGDSIDDRFIPCTPDLVVEVRSRSESASILKEKLDDYRATGTPLIWVVDPARRTVRVIRSGAPATTLRESDALGGGDSFLGFVAESRNYSPSPEDSRCVAGDEPRTRTDASA